MNIAIFIPNYNAGGTEQVALRLGNFFSDKDYNVLLISLADKDFPYKTNFKIINLDHDLPIRRLNRFVYRMARLRRVLIENNIDTILSMGEYPNFLTSVLPIRGIRKINRYTNSALSASGVTRHLMTLLARIAFYFSDKTIVPAKRLAEELGLNVNSEKIRVITNPISIEEIERKAKVNDREAFHTSRPFFIHVGQLVQQKDHDYLLSCYANYLKMGGTWGLKLVGKGERERELKNLVVHLGIEHFVEFTGWCENPFVLIIQSQALLLTSRWEGVPNVMLEAMALGRPIISVDCPTGPREVLDGGRFGRLIPREDQDLFSNSLLELETNPTLAPELSRLSRFRVTDFEINTVGRRFLDILEDTRV
tara:strand:+ start:50 stop:1144 length:1095 start_codon:yes stop_codon:yes gene_type:complete